MLTLLEVSEREEGVAAFHLQSSYELSCVSRTVG